MCVCVCVCVCISAYSLLFFMFTTIQTVCVSTHLYKHERKII